MSPTNSGLSTIVLPLHLSHWSCLLAEVYMCQIIYLLYNLILEQIKCHKVLGIWLDVKSTLLANIYSFVIQNLTQHIHRASWVSWEAREVFYYHNSLHFILVRLQTTHVKHWKRHWESRGSAPAHVVYYITYWNYWGRKINISTVHLALLGINHECRLIADIASFICREYTAFMSHKTGGNG